MTATRGASAATPAPSSPVALTRTPATGWHQLLTPAERRALGRTARAQVPRTGLGHWAPDEARQDPVEVLMAQDADRIPELRPIRYGRMLASPFAFLRGAAAVMAADLATQPRTGLTVQLGGDAHIANFGFYASPERQLHFDINDFDETLPGPWEWDVKRLAASVTVASRDNGFTRAACQSAVEAALRAYQSSMAAFAELTNLELWYFHVRVEDIFAAVSAVKQVKGLQVLAAKARQRDSRFVAGRMTTLADGQIRFIERPPLTVRLTEAEVSGLIEPVFRSYLDTLPDAQRALLERYAYADAARRVVGVGSVGTPCYIVALTGRDEHDPLILQLKNATTSVPSPYLPPSRYANHAQRIVCGQRLVQAVSDIFLGWIKLDHGDFYWRQLKDMKASIDIPSLTPPAMENYATACGTLLAHAHARSGDPLQISAYLGKGDQFVRAVGAFAERYADQTERDHAALAAAVKQGRIKAETGVQSKDKSQLDKTTSGRDDGGRSERVPGTLRRDGSD